MSYVRLYMTSFGIDYDIVTATAISEFEAVLQKFSQEELLEYATEYLYLMGDRNPSLTLSACNTSREGLLDLLVGWRAIGAISSFPPASGGRNNSQLPMV